MTKEYFSSNKYEVFESKEMIVIFKKTFFSYLKLFKSFNKDFYNYEEDETMIIIEEIKE